MSNICTQPARPKERQLQQIFQCETCTAYFTSALAFRNHVIAEKGLDDLDLLGFDLDGKTSPTEDASSSHSRENATTDCAKCGKTCKSYKGLKQHMAKVHSTGERAAACEICGKQFRHKYAVKFHVRQVHEKATRVECSLCGKQVYNKYMLVKHQLGCSGLTD